MNKKVTLRELVGARIVVALCIAVYYWCWARNDLHNYYVTIQNVVGGFTLFSYGIYMFERKSIEKKV